MAGPVRLGVLMVRETQAEIMAGMREKLTAQGYEIRDLKEARARSEANNGAAMKDQADQLRELKEAVQPLAEILPELKTLLTRAAEVDGMTKLARAMLGGGALVTLGALLLGGWRWLIGN